MYSNNILNFQGSTTILNACTKSLETYWMPHVHADVNGKAQPLMLVEYPSEKESSLYPTVYRTTGYIISTCH